MKHSGMNNLQCNTEQHKVFNAIGLMIQGFVLYTDKHDAKIGRHLQWKVTAWTHTQFHCEQSSEIFEGLLEQRFFETPSAVVWIPVHWHKPSLIEWFFPSHYLSTPLKSGTSARLNTPCFLSGSRRLPKLVVPVIKRRRRRLVRHVTSLLDYSIMEKNRLQNMTSNFSARIGDITHLEL